MEIEINCCNNIDKANITLAEKKLNIKFAPNGTGKSTISRAIQCTVNGDEQGLSDLLPFRYRGSNPDAVQPRVTGVDGLQNVMCFNEKYVDQFTFQPDELVSNSFVVDR